MAFTNPDKELIQTRILKLETAYNTGDIDTALSLFVDNGLDYSDYGVNSLNMTKPAFKAFLQSMFTELHNPKITTVSVSGNREFIAWEWEMEFVRKNNSSFEEMNREGVEEGGWEKMRGVSLSWWDEEGRIVRERDYARFV